MGSSATGRGSLLTSSMLVIVRSVPRGRQVSRHHQQPFQAKPAVRLMPSVVAKKRPAPKPSTNPAVLPTPSCPSSSSASAPVVLDPDPPESESYPLKRALDQIDYMRDRIVDLNTQNLELMMEIDAFKRRKTE
eukprot:7750754-Pyramimonas_sp.AAC.1